MYTIKTNLINGIKIASTKKEFILYNLDKDNKITEYSLCNDLRNRKKYEHFKVISVVKISNLVNINF